MADKSNHFQEGFRESLSRCNQISDELFLMICYDIIEFQQLKISSLRTKKYYENIQDIESSKSKDIIDNVIKSVSAIVRSACENKETGEELKSRLDKLSVLSNDKINLLVQAWQKEGKQLILTGCVFQDLNIGKLLDIKWKLGMAVSSNDCKHLNTPYVTMAITVADQSGTAIQHSIEMTVPQFRNFSKQLKEMSVLLDSV
ncbi:hypothetical protein LOTGIDRAFT_153516 [Lottia gigantea]|uniref:COMM domain-containing protein 6 n=1 Tax=Lottia gigantea TaxID=225164 RepID=V4AFW4_LOTGI|nr:hypothetical protein LOTGIDRAFT_153516 [Lottia gigantea]ESO94035.1 hypothetical protein LOTGIDRAFT_153516 [Lottia gigantea]